MIDALVLDSAVLSPSSLNLTKSPPSFTATSGEVVALEFVALLASGYNPLKFTLSVPSTGVMNLIDVQVISLGPNVTNSSIPVGYNATLDTNNDGFFDVAVLDFGYLVNNGGFSMTNDVVILVTVSPTNSTLLTSDGMLSTDINVTARFQFLTMGAPGLVPVVVDTIRPVTFVQPYLQTELIRSSHEATVVLGDPVHFSLTISNLGRSIAYDTRVLFSGDFPFTAPAPFFFSVASNNGTTVGSQLLGSIVHSGDSSGLGVQLSMDLAQFNIDSNESLIVSFTVLSIAGSVPQNDDRTYFASAVTSYDSVPDVHQLVAFYLRRETTAQEEINFFQQELNSSGVCLGGVEISVLTAIFGLANPMFPNPIFV
jgi:hypothetical protein